ncbi:MAG TPA: hypothetical protein VFU86_15295, partial [Terriglobales bacterium]|nr:hypothetical protein [Terriglobales bacterium]
NSVANTIYNSTGFGDIFATWMNQLAQYWQANGATSLWNLVTGLVSGVISLWLILSAFVIFPICYLVFTFFYAIYGSVLYVTGPFVLALLPARGLGQLSRTYLVNLMTFEAWGIIYAVLQVLISAVNLGSINAVLGANGVLNSFVGSSQMILLALTASIFSFAIALIPFIASRVVRGDLGSTMLTMIGAMTIAASSAAKLAAASFIGVGEGALASQAAGGGATASSSPPPPPPPGGSRAALPAPVSAGGSSEGASPTAAITSTSMAPSPLPAAPTSSPSAAPSNSSSGDVPPSASPWRASSRPGQYRGFNVPHAAAWYIGYSLGSAYRGLKGGNDR